MAVYEDRSEDDANQGDIFEDVPFLLYPRVDAAGSLGMIISHDCDCDKFLKPRTPIPEAERPTWPISMAPVHAIGELTGGRPNAVRAGNMYRYFYLPSENGSEELVADLWLVQPVPIEVVVSRVRRSSLSSEWRGRLWAQIIRLRTGRSIEAIAQAMGSNA